MRVDPGLKIVKYALDPLPQAILHPSADQHHDSTGSGHQQHSKQAPKIHGHEASLALLTYIAETILPLLAARAHAPWGLRDKTPHDKTPCVHPPSSGP